MEKIQIIAHAEDLNGAIGPLSGHGYSLAETETIGDTDHIALTFHKVTE